MASATNSYLPRTTLRANFALDFFLCFSFPMLTFSQPLLFISKGKEIKWELQIFHSVFMPYLTPIKEDEK